MRTVSIAAVLVLALSLASGLRADYALIVATPENINDIDGLKIEATSEPSGLVRFVVIRQAPKSQFRPQGLFRLNVEPNVWTEANVAADEREGELQYRMTVAPSHLNIAEFNLVESEGLGGTWYRITLKDFAPKAAASGSEKDATKTETKEKPTPEEPKSTNDRT